MVETTYKIAGAPNLALVTDLHNRPYHAIISSLRQRRPSIICIAGDVLYGSQPDGERSPLVSQTNVLPFLRSCADIAPSFFALGNHEWMLDAADIREIGRTGVTVLDNRWVKTVVEGKIVLLGGLTSAYWTDYRSFRSTRAGTERYPRQTDLFGINGMKSAPEHIPETGWLEDYSSEPGYHVLLSHHPCYFPLIPSSVELVLSGHAHGGQVRLPNPFKAGWQGLYAPGQGFLPGWTRGVYDERLVVSAGLSNTVLVPRIFNPTEIVYLQRA